MSTTISSGDGKEMACRGVSLDTAGQLMVKGLGMRMRRGKRPGGPEGGAALADVPARSVRWPVSLLAAVTVGALLMAGPGDTALAGTGSRAGTAYNGTPAVGALFIKTHGRLHQHFCTASVVHSPQGDLLITAAHCVDGQHPPSRGTIVFAPGYHSGIAPHGIWRVRAIYVDTLWSAEQSPNNDFAFLVAGPPGSHIEKHTGAETLMAHQKLPVQARVIGYPNSTSRPITCTAPARSYDPGTLLQLRFRCGGYTNGTSGGPFLTDVSSKTGDGRLFGVIGGYQQGGDTPSVSYSSKFLANVLALYKTATSAGAG
jgi:V8-like Glu-specific endopeptidase